MDGSRLDGTGSLDSMACKRNAQFYIFSVCSAAWRYGMPATLFICQVTIMYTYIERKGGFKSIYNHLKWLPQCVYERGSATHWHSQ
jgi:hypothetical protein